MVEIKNILCAVDFSEASARVAAYTRLLAGSLKASVTVIHVSPDVHEYVFYESPTSLEDLVEEAMAEANKRMGLFIRENFSDLDAKGRVLSGYPDEEILASIKSENIDLVIMGTHGRRGFEKILFGSVAERVVKKSSVPVLTIRP